MMSTNRFIKFPGMSPFAIDKPYFTVGIGAGYDVSLDGSAQKILFSIHHDGKTCTLIPGEERVKINSKSVSRPTTLEYCDRIEQLR